MGSPRIQLAPGAAFDRYASWSWLPSEARHVDAPPGLAPRFDRELERLVGEALAERGYQRVEAGADLRIGVLLDVRREVVTVRETGAMQQVSSLHESGSFQVQAAVERQRTYEHSRLVLFAVDPRRGEVVWQGILERRFRGAFAPHIEGVVATLLSRFPEAGEGGEGPIRRRDFRTRSGIQLSSRGSWDRRRGTFSLDRSQRRPPSHSSHDG
jgi:hypothetical protein